MPTSMRFVGDAAVRIDVQPVDRHAVAAAISAGALPGCVDVVPGERSVVVRFTPGTDLDAALPALASCVAVAARAEHDPAAEVVIPVRYDGVDLADVAEATGFSPREVVERHVRASYEVAFLGFMPGFAYLDGLPESLVLPRLSTPRQRVEGGAVGIAAGRTCVYPRTSPGGWRVLGHTDVALFDAEAVPPTPLAPGVRVRFVEV